MVIVNKEDIVSNSQVTIGASSEATITYTPSSLSRTSNKIDYIMNSIRCSSLADMTYKVLADDIEIYSESNIPPVDFDTPFYPWKNGRLFEKNVKVVLTNTSLSSQTVDVGFLGEEVEYGY